MYQIFSLLMTLARFDRKRIEGRDSFLFSSMVANIVLKAICRLDLGMFNNLFAQLV